MNYGKYFYDFINGKSLRSKKNPVWHQQTCPICGRTLVNLYQRDKRRQCKKCWDAEDYKEKVEVVLDHERKCDACIFYEDCGGISIRSGPNGPIYSPCAERDASFYLDPDMVEEVYDEIMQEGAESKS